MITTIILGCTIMVLVVLLWRLVWRTHSAVDPLKAWQIQGHRVNVDAFRLLVDRGEMIYLRNSVPQIEFRRLQRKRIALAIRSLRMIASDAGLLMRVATLARSTEDSETANAADRLFFLSFWVTIYARVSAAYLLLEWAFPGRIFRVRVPVDRYKRLLQSSDWILARRRQVAVRTRVAA